MCYSEIYELKIHYSSQIRLSERDEYCVILLGYWQKGTLKEVVEQIIADDQGLKPFDMNTCFKLEGEIYSTQG